MLETTVDEVETTFAAAKNMNAALKNFLKKEVQSNESAGRFAKNFRSAVSTGRPALVRSFIEQNLSSNQPYFLLTARYAHAQFVDSFVNEVVTAYGDQFNATYEPNGDVIDIKDKKEFSRIVKEVADQMETDLKAAGLPRTNFMKNSILMSIFEANVLKEVLPILQK